MPKKNIPINYSARDYESIRASLIEHVKRYYSSIYKDFNEASFNSLMLDMVSYIGDSLSFYLDYNANEGFIETANEFDNILKLGKPLGYVLKENPSSHGIGTFFVLVPANSTGLGPDPRYTPILKKGSIFSARNGNNFILNEDIFFSDESNEVVVGRVDEDSGLPTFYAIRAYGQIISGRLEETLVSVGDFERFLKIKVDLGDVAEILLVEDDEGHEYFEVDYLSQDVVYRPVLNRIEGSLEPQSLLKPFVVPRRFVVERDGRDVYLRFGHGSDSLDITSDEVADPSNVVLEVFGKEYITDTTFDPTNLINTDKFGVAPANTTLRIVTRVNTVDNVNAGTDTITNVLSADLDFDDVTTLDSSVVNSVRNSLEVTNEEAIVGDVDLPTSEELKIRIFNSFASQNRAVTAQDYQALVYRMPPKFGAIKRVKIVRDEDSFKRNLNMYVVSENSNGKLVETNATVKENLRTWINKNRMINDTIDILDAKIINLGINFEAIGDLERDKYDILSDAVVSLTSEFSTVKDVGEPLFITDIYNALKKVQGLVDVTRVKVFQKSGGLYSDIRFNVNENLSSDGRYLEMPKNVIFEFKYPENDIKGVIR